MSGSKILLSLIKISWKNSNEESNEGYFLEVDVQYLEKLHELHKDLPFLPERIKIQKVENFAANLPDKTGYFANIRNLRQALNHWLVLKKLHRIIKFSKKIILKRLF